MRLFFWIHRDGVYGYGVRLRVSFAANPPKTRQTASKPVPARLAITHQPNGLTQDFAPAGAWIRTTRLDPAGWSEAMPSIAPLAHNRGEHTSDSWITPKWLIDCIGPFDLDPCASNPQPWPCAKHQYTVDDDGFSKTWKGFVYCNPPYGRETSRWLGRMSTHDNGIALVFARTETRMFFDYVWPWASALLFLNGRLTFCRPDGSLAGANSGGPSVLVGYGSQARRRLLSCSKLGSFVDLIACRKAVP